MRSTNKNNISTLGKLMKISQFRNTFFENGSAPAVNTIKKWINNNIVNGFKLDGQYYICAISFSSKLSVETRGDAANSCSELVIDKPSLGKTGDRLVDEILQDYFLNVA